MNNNLRRLQRMIQIFGSAPFYNCEATSTHALCIGRFSPEVLLKALQYKFKMDVSPSGYLWLRRGNYSITMTN